MILKANPTHALDGRIPAPLHIARRSVAAHRWLVSLIPGPIKPETGPLFTFVTFSILDYHLCVPPSLSAAVGEPVR